MSRLAARVLTGTTLAVVVAGLLWLHGTFERGVVSFWVASLLALLSVWELQRMGSLGEGQLGFPLGVACLATAGAVHRPPDVDWPFSIGALGSLYSRALFGAVVGRIASLVVQGWKVRLPRADLWAIGLVLWLIPPLFALVQIDWLFGVEGLAVLVVLAKIGDNAGYFVGRAIGKRHPFPGISPGKTVAGCVASLAAGVVTGAILLPLTLGERTWPQAALGALVGGAINLAAQASDLSESWVKRQAGVKDSSALLGPSGGVLDVIDSLFFSTPLALVLWTWVYGPPGR